jgi:hypothetical protein
MSDVVATQRTKDAPKPQPPSVLAMSDAEFERRLDLLREKFGTTRRLTADARRDWITRDAAWSKRTLKGINAANKAFWSARSGQHG